MRTDTMMKGWPQCCTRPEDFGSQTERRSTGRSTKGIIGDNRQNQGSAALQAELLEVAIIKTDATAIVSHETTPVSWTVAQDMKPKPRPSKDTKAPSEDATFTAHAPTHKVLEWTCESQPVILARLQELLMGN